MAEVADPQAARDRILQLAFDGDEERFARFTDALHRVAPDGSQVILRGSAVTGERWADGQPFDADGPGTSDLDVTFLSKDVCGLFKDFYIVGLHTVPLTADNPEACPELAEVRHELSQLAGRPVNLQASTSLVQFARDVLFDQPYYTLLEKADEDVRETSAP